MKRGRPGLAWIPLILGLVSCAASCSGGGEGGDAEAAAASANLVVTANGPVRGVADGDLRTFRGIPYAAPPVGERRWQPPQPHPSWTAVRDAVEFGTPCWQNRIDGFYDRGDIPRSEDCLHLNVWTRSNPGDNAPVMVWIHGGALLIGHGHLDVYDGAALTEQGVVLVSINYRLGALGFFAHEALTEESAHQASGNQGIQDQTAALQWVQANIAAFGGDPDNVTIFGESAGSWSVCYQVATPLAKGLFHRAIGQSGGCFAPHPHLDQAGTTPQSARSAHAVGAELGEVLGTQDLAALRAIPAETLYAKVAQAQWNPGTLVNVDGHTFPAQMSEIFAAGAHNRVPTMIGSNADEGTTLWVDFTEQDADAYRAGVEQAWGGRAETILEAYADDAEISIQRAQQQIRSDVLFAWQMRTWARALAPFPEPAYLYFFSHVPDLGGDYGTGLGAYHAAEIAYAFGNIATTVGGASRTPRPSDVEVSRLLVGYWTNFAKTGDPNGEGLPHWPRYEPAEDAALELAAAPRVIKNLRKAKLDAMDQAFSGRSG